ncbi:MAG: M14 family zinc carboxypeptidase [Gemmatimonadota bacterium]
MRRFGPRGGAVAAAAALVAAAGSARRARAQVSPTAVPAPATVLGFEPGADRQLADWGQIVRYMDTVAAASDRVRIDTIGRSTLDRPFVLLTISDPANLSRLRELRGIQDRLADPRLIDSAEEEADLLRRGRAVVLVTAAIHPTEVGSSLLPVRLVYRLASSSAPEVLRILRETIVLIVPALTPDGVQIVADWYRSTIDMPWEGSPPPYLYHPYVGHDTNRDWYAFTQRETRITVEQVHNVWHPQVVYDVHQQATDGSRFFVPPWLDPVDSSVDPLLVSATNALGTAIAWDLHRAGRTGVVVHATYDAWTPARAYPLYHGGVRILSETAGARLASPVTVPFDSLKPEPGFDPRRRSWNFPEPWPGGPWGLGEILGYMEDAAMAMLRRVAADRAAWLESFLAVGKRAIAGRRPWPTAWVIPFVPGKEVAVAELSRILLTGGLALRRSDAPAKIGGRTVAAGSLIVPMRQPYASFAQTLLEVHAYPTPAKEGAAPTPYDVTAHNLPLLLGLEAIPVFEGSVDGRPLERPPVVERRAPGLTRASDVLVGLYQPWVPSIDEGWTRWLFDQYAVPYVTLHLQDLRKGNLIRAHTAVVLPSVSPDTLASGWAEGSMPARYVGGLEGPAAGELRTFVEAGGTLVALDEASTWVVDEFELPVHDPTRNLPPSEYFSAGSIVRLEVDPEVAEELGLEPATPAWIQRGHAFVPDGEAGPVRVIARYGAGELLLSGLLRGAEHLAGLPAAVEIPFGRGRIVLFGFRPQYRGQSLATYPLFFRSLRR